LQVLSSHTFATHLTSHAQSFEYFCRIRTCTDRTRLTGTVVLTVSSLTYTTKMMSLNDTLETFTFRSSNHVHISNVIEELNSDYITQIEFLFETLELGQVALGCYSSSFKVAHQRLGSMFLFCFLETYLDSCIAIFFYTLNLSNDTRTSFDNSAWYVFTISTENGCHSDFLS